MELYLTDAAISSLRASCAESWSAPHAARTSFISFMRRTKSQERYRTTGPAFDLPHSKLSVVQIPKASWTTRYVYGQSRQFASPSIGTAELHPPGLAQSNVRGKLILEIQRLWNMVSHYFSGVLQNLRSDVRKRSMLKRCLQSRPYGKVRISMRSGNSSS